MAIEAKTEPELSNTTRRYLQDVEDKLVRRHADGRDWHHRAAVAVPCRVGKVHRDATAAGYIERLDGAPHMAWSLTAAGRAVKAAADAKAAAGYGKTPDGAKAPVGGRARFAVAW